MLHKIRKRKVHWRELPLVSITKWTITRLCLLVCFLRFYQVYCRMSIYKGNAGYHTERLDVPESRNNFINKDSEQL